MFYNNRLLSILSAVFIVIFTQTMQAAATALTVSKFVAAENRATVTKQGNVIFAARLQNERRLPYPTPPATLTNHILNARYASTIRSIDIIHAARKIGATQIVCYFPDDLERYEATLQYAENNSMVNAIDAAYTQRVIDELQTSYNLHEVRVTLPHHEKAIAHLNHREPDSNCDFCRAAVDLFHATPQRELFRLLKPSTTSQALNRQQQVKP